MNRYIFYSRQFAEETIGSFEALTRDVFMLPIKSIANGKLMSTTYDLQDYEFAVVDPNGSVIIPRCRATNVVTSSRGIEVTIERGPS